jgi:hypothetical protein
MSRSHLPDQERTRHEVHSEPNLVLGLNFLTFIDVVTEQ